MMRSALRRCVRGIAGALIASSGARLEQVHRSILALAGAALALCCAGGIALASAVDRPSGPPPARGPAALGSRASLGSGGNASPQSATGSGVTSGGNNGAPRAHGGRSGARGIRGAGPTIPTGTEAVSRLFTANSRTYKSAEGLYTTTLYGQQVNVKDPNGTWVPMPAGASASKASSPKPYSSVKPGISKDCPLESGSPTTSFCTSTTDYVGYDGTNTDNSLIQFNVKEALPAGANVLNAELGMYLYESSTTNGVSVSAYAVAKEREWTNSATWNTYNGTNAWTTAGGDFSTFNAVEKSSVTKPAEWQHWYPTQIVQEWVNESGTNKTNYGFLLADTTQKQTNNLLSFYSSKASSEKKPYLTISWRPRGQEDAPFYSMQSFKVDSQSTMKVNLASGDLFVNSTDLAVRGLGVPFLAEHNYDSLNDEGGSVNPWYSLSGATVYGDKSVVVGFNRHDFAPFIRKPNGEYITPAGMLATLCEVNGTTCKGNSIDGTKAVYALTFNQSGNKIDLGSNGGIWSVADRYGNALAYNYEGGLKIKDTQGRTFTRHTTEVKGFTVTSSWVESGGGTREVKYAYNTDAKLETYTDAEGKKTKYTYDEAGNLKEIKDPKGNVTTLNYDSSRRITKITQAEVGGKHPIWEYSYFAGTDTEHGRKCDNLAAEGITKKTVVKDPNGHERTFCANVLDEVLQAFDADGNKTEAAYNSLGEVTTSVAAAGNVESFIYGSEGVGTGRLECVVSGTTEKQSKCEGLSSSLLVTSYKYKDEKNPYLSTQVKNPQGNSVFRCYNEGKQEGSEGPACPTKSSGPAGSLQNVTDQLSAEKELSFEYNTNGTIKSSKDARGNTTSYEYDEKGNLKKITPPTGSEEGEKLKETTITVDSESRPHVITDGAGHVETINYDVLDHVTEIAYTGAGTAKTVKFEYDLGGNLIKREDPTGTTKYTVDALNRLTKESLPGSLSDEYGFDPISNMTSFTDGGGTTKYEYNKLNELESMTEPGTLKTTFEYDTQHRLTKITYPSKAVQSFKLEATTGRPESISFEGLSGTTVPNLSYAYNNAGANTGLIQSVTESTGPKTSYKYDKLDHLLAATRKNNETNKEGALYEFVLDGDGNRSEQKVNLKEWEGAEETTHYVTNAANLLECRQSVTGGLCSKNILTELSHYEYDKAGEQTAITPKADTSGSTFAYNAAKETKAITPSGGSEQALSYGGTGQDDLVSLGSTTLQRSLLGLTREVNASGTSYYARTPGGLLIDQRTPSGNFNPLFDAQGDVIALVSSTGKVERTFRYGPYGENVESSGTQTIPFPFGFKGGYRMPGGNKGKTGVANGLYHFGQRYYDPTTGRWTQRDPVSQVTSPVAGNRFLFADGDPTNLSDPSGESEQSDAVCQGVGLGIDLTIEGATRIPGSGVIPGQMFAAGCQLGAGLNENEGRQGLIEEAEEGWKKVEETL